MQPLPVIDTQYLAQTLERMLRIPSPTGYTDNVVNFVSDELQGHGLDVEITRRGAIRAIRPGKKRHKHARALISHVDTLGAQVKRVKDNGRLELVPIGHWSARFAEGARTTIFSEKGTYRGTILPLKASGHTFNEEIDTQPVGWEFIELRIDALARNPQEVNKLGIEIGDIVAIDPQPEFLENGFIVSRHLDNKAGVAVMLAALEAMNRVGTETPVDVHFLFSVFEEIGIGASNILLPEVSSMVTLDNGTTAPGQNSSEFGVTISMADQQGPFDYHLTKKLVDLCKTYDIHYQKDIFRFYRSDSASALEAGADVRTSLITFGVDASHGYERIHMHSLRSLAELSIAYVISEVEVAVDADKILAPSSFTTQPSEDEAQTMMSEQAIVSEDHPAKI